MVLGDDGPAVRQQLHFASAGVDHRFDGYCHSGPELLASARLAVVQHLRVLVEHAADAVAAVLAHDGEALLFHEALDRVADVAQVPTRPDRTDAAPHRIEANLREPGGLYRRRSDHVHAARVAVVTVLDDRDIDIDDVAIS